MSCHCSFLRACAETLGRDRADPDDLAVAHPACERQRHLEQQLERAVEGAPLGRSRERAPAAIAQPVAEAPEEVTRLATVAAPYEIAAGTLDHAGQRLGRELREVARQLEP